MTANAPTIRALRSGEVDLWRSIRLRALREAPDAFGTTYEEAIAAPAEQWQRNVESATAPDGLQAIYLAEIGDTVAGCARVSRDPERTTALVTSMWVDPAARRQGVAAALLMACERWARDHECDVVELEVAEQNSGARLLYGRVGFVETGEVRELRDGSTERTVVMAKTLD